MNLPKNVIQISESEGNDRVYIEDYVVSYLKQINSLSMDMFHAVALYGNRNSELQKNYYFVYGACRLESINREVKHLSGAQNQEIEKLRKKYFPEYSFVGYCLLQGEVLDGISLYESGICSYHRGYFQFYEQNERMLSYMLATKDEEKSEQSDFSKSERSKSDNVKYEEIRKRQEDRRQKSTLSSKDHQIKKEEWRSTRISAAILLGIASVAAYFSLSQQADSDIVQPSVVAADSQSISQNQQTDVYIMEEKLEQALLEENNKEENSKEECPKEECTREEVQPEEKTEEPKEQTETSVSYQVQQGDTLISISCRQYGTDKRVSDICKANNIKNPNDIKQGQTIILPK